MAGNVALTSSQQLLTHGKKIVAIGRNYAEHAKELGNAIPQEPFFFLKPTTSYIRSGSKIEIPLGGQATVHHEIESFESYIVGMLTNLGQLPLTRIHNMLKMYTGGSDVKYSKTPQQLGVFLQQLCRQEKLERGPDGMYKLFKK